MKRLMSIALFAAVVASAEEPSEAPVAYPVSVPMPISHAAPAIPAHPAHVTLADQDDARLENHPAVEVKLGHAHPDYVGKLAQVGHPAHGY